MELVQGAVAVFQARGMFERGGELDEQCIVFSLEIFCYVEAVGREHVGGLGDEFFVEPDLGDCVEAFEDEVDSAGFEDVLGGSECFLVDPWLLADPLEFFGIGAEVGSVDSAGMYEGGED